jgi:hypothetical protein
MSYTIQNKNTAMAELLSQGIEAFEALRLDDAMLAFRKAAVTDLGEAEPWFWMGRIHEERQDRAMAGHCYFMALDMRSSHGPARQALARLGFLGGRGEAQGQASKGLARPVPVFYS